MVAYAYMMWNSLCYCLSTAYVAWYCIGFVYIDISTVIFLVEQF